MSSKELTDEQVIKDWAKQFPKYRRFMSNIEMLRRLYVTHNKPPTVSEAMVDQEAKLTLFITRFKGKKTMKLCSECNGKPSPKETEKCGVSDFIDMYSYAYMAGDETAEIEITIPPWYEHDPNLKLEETYVVEGLIRTYEGQMQIQPTEKMVMVEAEDEDLATMIKELFELHKMKIPEKVFDKAMEKYDVDEVGQALNELGIELQEGEYKVAP